MGQESTTALAGARPRSQRADAIVTVGEAVGEPEPITVTPLAPRGADTTRPAAEIPTGPADWQRRFQTRLVISDVLAAALASAGAFFARFGATTVDIAPSVLAVVIGLPLLWLVVLLGNRAYERRVVGAGAIEYQRLLRAFLYLTALVTFTSYAAHIELPRGYFLLALPLTPLLSGVQRYTLRKRLHRRRLRGLALTSVLAVGEPHAIVAVAAELQRDVTSGMQVVGACVPVEVVDDPRAAEVLGAAGIPLHGDIDSVQDAARRSGAHTVAVLAGATRPEKLRWVSAQLEGCDIDLVVSPGITEVAGRRLHVQPVAGLPLVYVDVPQFTGVARLVKAVFDTVVAAAGLVLLAPFLLLIGLLVRLTSRGPALFLQTRVGRDGKTFTMVKFRTMYADAEHRRSALLGDNDSDSDGVLFKIREDPRVTPVGRVLRRFSLDELPQLLNVVTGSMSLVGPRPPLPDEVSRYGARVWRRLLVKPGLTGLWQISGRSDLSWEDSIRLDLRYVENWSLALDAVVLFKTSRAVLKGSGAY